MVHLNGKTVSTRAAQAWKWTCKGKPSKQVAKARVLSPIATAGTLAKPENARSRSDYVRNLSGQRPKLSGKCFTGGCIVHCYFGVSNTNGGPPLIGTWVCPSFREPPKKNNKKLSFWCSVKLIQQTIKQRQTLDFLALKGNHHFRVPPKKKRDPFQGKP